jgi:hypothetical protein
MKHIFGLITLGIGLAAWGTAVHAQEPGALAAAENGAGHRAIALALFEHRAATGDSAAAERAGQMLYDGQPLEGAAMTEDQWRALSYLGQAARAGRPAARQLMQRALPPPAADEYVPGPYGC